MRDLNYAVLTGRLGQAPELRKTQSDTFFTSFSLAVSYDDKTDWIPCVAWQKTAEIICQYYGKGDRICLSGRVTTSEYETQGVKKRVVQITVNQVVSCGTQRRPEGAAHNAEDMQGYEAVFDEMDPVF